MKAPFLCRPVGAMTRRPCGGSLVEGVCDRSNWGCRATRVVVVVVVDRSDGTVVGLNINGRFGRIAHTGRDKEIHM